MLGTAVVPWIGMFVRSHAALPSAPRKLVVAKNSVDQTTRVAASFCTFSYCVQSVNN